ncbi:MAG: hypothetical protein DHS20C14_14810 [Phycisphaeraceae bacterium]|nr:MAG: hypothetical protein DHS20C14_14810 [Phycisphaeraceae bacterium]
MHDRRGAEPPHQTNGSGQARTNNGNPNGSSSGVATLADSEGVIEEVFLTPRVLDQGAFGEYAKTLEELIRKAGEEGKTLASAQTEVREVTERTGKAGRELGARLDLANTLVRTIDERAKLAEKKLAAAEQHLADVGSLDERVDARVEAAVEGILGRVHEAVAAQEKRCEQTVERLGAAERTARTTAANAAATIVQLEERVTAIQARAEAVAEQSDIASSALEVRAKELLAEINAKAEKLGARFAGIETAAGKLGEILGGDGDATTLVTRVELAAGRAERIGGQLETLSTNADASRESLDAAVRDAGERVGTLEQRAEIVGPMNDAYEDIASSVPLLTETIRSASDQITELVKIQSVLREQIGESAQLASDVRERLKDQTKDLETILADATRRLETRAEGAGERLTDLIVRAERAAASVARGPEAPRPAAAPTGTHRPVGTSAEDAAADAEPAVRPNTPRPQRPANPLDALDLTGSGNVIPVWRPRDPSAPKDRGEGEPPAKPERPSSA